MNPLLKRKFIVLLAVGAVLLLPLAAQALVVDPAFYTVTRVGSDPNQITATGAWAENSNFSISWVITAPVNPGDPFTYHYEIFAQDGTGASNPGGLSHWILTVSPNFEFAATPSFAYETPPPGGFSTANGNPGLPSAILSGFKTAAGDITFTSFNAPVWGDFYAKDGNAGGIDNPVYAYNAMFGVTPTSGDSPFDGWIARPDSKGGGFVPVPPTAWLLGSGLVGLLLLGRRRKTR